MQRHLRPQVLFQTFFLSLVLLCGFFFFSTFFILLLNSQHNVHFYRISDILKFSLLSSVTLVNPQPLQFFLSSPMGCYSKLHLTLFFSQSSPLKRHINPIASTINSMQMNAKYVFLVFFQTQDLQSYQNVWPILQSHHIPNLMHQSFPFHKTSSSSSYMCLLCLLFVFINGNIIPHAIWDPNLGVTSDFSLPLGFTFKLSPSLDQPNDVTCLCPALLQL